MGCSLLHLTLEAAHISHEARSFSFRSLFADDDLGTEVGEDMVEAVLDPVEPEGECHCKDSGVVDIVDVL